MNDFLIVFGSMLLSFSIGIVSSFLLGGMLSLKYLICKISRGRKVLIFADTQNKRKVFIGKYEGSEKEGVVSWKYLGGDKLTEIVPINVGNYYAVQYISLNASSPERAYNLSPLGEKPARVIDQQTFNHILTRALSKPTIDDAQGKLLKFVLILGLICAGACIMIYLKMINVEQLVKGLGVI